jgi:SAM-dependent methyltransferase
MNKIYHSRTAFVIDILNKCSLPSKKVLDVGFIGDCEEATVHYTILDNLKELDRLVGIDIDESKMSRFLSNPKTIERIKKRNLKYEVMSIFNTDFEDNTFDYVLLLEVFEHLFSPYSVFKEVYRILKPGGSVIITYPNPLELGKLLSYIRQKDLLDRQYLNSFKGATDHKVFPHPICFAIYLNEVGFQTHAIEFIKYDFKPFFLCITCIFGTSWIDKEVLKLCGYSCNQANKSLNPLSY